MRSALGKEINMAALIARNEKVRAVGNMNVNARGDLVDSNNNVITSANKRVESNYSQTVNGDIGLKPTVATHEDTDIFQQSLEEDTLSTEEQELFNETDEDIEK